jgi:hypothetical protein
MTDARASHINANRQQVAIQTRILREAGGSECKNFKWKYEKDVRTKDSEVREEVEGARGDDREDENRKTEERKHRPVSQERGGQ